MKPNKKLIKALRSAAARIENDGSYDWTMGHSCNCGILAQELLEMKSDELRQTKGIGCYWDTIAGWFKRLRKDNDERCFVTGNDWFEIVKKLMANGLELADITRIENAGKRRSGMERQRENPAFVANYMRCIADRLERKLAKEQPVQEQETIEELTTTETVYENETNQNVNRCVVQRG